MRNLLLAAWAGRVWFTSTSPAWRRVLGLCSGLTLNFAGASYDVIADECRQGVSGIWCGWFLVVLALAAACAYDERLFTPRARAALRALPMVSLIAIAMLV